MTSELIFGVTALICFVIGIRASLLHRALLGQLLAINIVGVSVFLMMIVIAYRQGGTDPVLHGLVLTGIVVAISATALGLALCRVLGGKDD